MKKARVSHFNTPAAHDLPNFLVLDSDFNMEHFLEYDDLQMNIISNTIDTWRQERIHNSKGLKNAIAYLKFYIPTLQILKIFLKLFNLSFILQVLLVIISIKTSVYLGIVVNIQSTLFVTPLIFPLTFMVNTGYTRRERALEHLSLFKSNLSSIFVFLNEWLLSKNPLLKDKLIKVIMDISNEMKLFLITRDMKVSSIYKKNILDHMVNVVALVEIMRNHQIEPLKNFILASMTSRQVFLTYGSIEQLTTIKMNTPPQCLRAFSKILIFFLPIILGPFYIYLQHDIVSQTSWQIFYVAILITFIFSVIQYCSDILFQPFEHIKIDSINVKDLENWTKTMVDAIFLRNKCLNETSLTQNGSIDILH